MNRFECSKRFLKGKIREGYGYSEMPNCIFGPGFLQNEWTWYRKRAPEAFFPRNLNPQNSLRGSFPHGCVPGAPRLSEGVLTPLALAPDSRRITITLKRWKRP